TAPCFSPFTDDEFIYIRKGGAQTTELVKYTISTQTEQILCTSLETSGFPSMNLDWGSQNKIIFDVGSGNSGIGYIINDNGSELQQFLPSNVNFISPKFNGNGDQIFATGGGFSGASVLLHPVYDL